MNPKNLQKFLKRIPTLKVVFFLQPVGPEVMRVHDDREQQYEEQRVLGALSGGEVVDLQRSAGEEARLSQSHCEQPRAPVDQQVRQERVHLAGNYVRSVNLHNHLGNQNRQEGTYSAIHEAARFVLPLANGMVKSTVTALFVKLPHMFSLTGMVFRDCSPIHSLRDFQEWSLKGRQLSIGWLLTDVRATY